jgi:hypothetical protein
VTRLLSRIRTVGTENMGREKRDSLHVRGGRTSENELVLDAFEEFEELAVSAVDVADDQRPAAHDLHEPQRPAHA